MYTCHVCGKCLKKKASMDSHIKVEHEKKKDHICHLCGTGFARAQGKDLLRYGRNFILLQLLRGGLRKDSMDFV